MVKGKTYSMLPEATTVHVGCGIQFIDIAFRHTSFHVFKIWNGTYPKIGIAQCDLYPH